MSDLVKHTRVSDVHTLSCCLPALIDVWFTTYEMSKLIGDCPCEPDQWHASPSHAQVLANVKGWEDMWGLFTNTAHLWPCDESITSFPAAKMWLLGISCVTSQLKSPSTPYRHLIDQSTPKIYPWICGMMANLRRVEVTRARTSKLIS